MKRLLFIFAGLILFARCATAAQVTFNEDFAGYTTLENMETAGWTFNISNHSSSANYCQYSISQGQFALTELEHGTVDPDPYGGIPSIAFLEMSYRLPVAVDGDFTLSVDVSWTTTSVDNQQHIWAMMQSPQGHHYTGAWYEDTYPSSEGRLHSRYFDKNASNYPEDQTTLNSATSNGGATFTISRTGNTLTVTSELTQANGSAVGSNPPTAEVSVTDMYANDDFQIIALFLDRSAYADMGDMFINNVSFTGESSTYNPVPEPASIMFLAAGILALIKRRIK